MFLSQRLLNPGDFENINFVRLIKSAPAYRQAGRCKTPEILRNEAYIDVRRNDEGLGQRRRWVVFISLIEGAY